MKSPGFTFYPKDWLCGDTVRTLHRMGGRGVAAYMFLLCEAWLREKPGTLPDDEDILIELSRVTKKEFDQFWPVMKNQFPSNGDGCLHNTRLREAWKLQVSRRKAAKARGLAK